MARLHLLGASLEDVPPLSALLQDATLRTPDIAWDRRGRRLVALLNRYRHEAGGGSRVRCALRVESVTAIRHQGWPSDPDAVLVLLAVVATESCVTLSFGGGIALKCEVEAPDLLLEDLSDPIPTPRRPRHD